MRVTGWHRWQRGDTKGAGRCVNRGNRWHGGGRRLTQWSAHNRDMQRMWNWREKTLHSRPVEESKASPSDTVYMTDCYVHEAEYMVYGTWYSHSSQHSQHSDTRVTAQVAWLQQSRALTLHWHQPYIYREAALISSWCGWVSAMTFFIHWRIVIALVLSYYTGNPQGEQLKRSQPAQMQHTHAPYIYIPMWQSTIHTGYTI